MQPSLLDTAPESATVTLHPFKLRVLRILLALGSIFLVIIWVFETSSNLITLIDRVAYPAMITIFLTSLTIIIIRPHMLHRVEWICFGAFAAYVSSSFFGVILNIEPSSSFYSLATLTQWLPLVYIAAFMFFDMRQAIIASILFYLMILVATIVFHFFTGNLSSAQLDVTPILLNILWAHPIYITTLMSVAWLKTNFVEARVDATLMSTAANIDYLTGVANRRAVAQTLQRILAAAQQRNGTCAILLIDIDHFKQINDRFGHDVGDMVLIHLAATLRAQLRDEDILGRWGGEEFIVIQQVSSGEAWQIAERLCIHVAHSAMPHDIPITISIGVAGSMLHDSPESLVKRADEALYRAKQRGRNRVEREQESERVVLV